MSFRLIVSEALDLTTIRVAGRLRDDAVTLLSDACRGAHRPLALDLAELTNASDAGVLLLHRLAAEGIHLLGVSQYMRLLLGRAPSAPGPRRRRGPSATKAAADYRPRRAKPRP